MPKNHEIKPSNGDEPQTVTSFKNSAIAKLKHFSLSTTSFTLLTSLYLFLAFNKLFIEKVNELHGVTGVGHILFMFTVVVFLWVLLNFFLTLSAFRFILKPFVIFLFIGSSVAFYFMKTYGILIDMDMMVNTLETDVSEASEIMTLAMFVDVFLWGIIPSVIVIYLPIRYDSFLKELARKGLTIVVSILIIGVIAAGYYQDYASLFRSNHYIRDLAVPVNFVNAIKAVVKDKYFKTTYQLVPLGQDAHLGKHWLNKNDVDTNDLEKSHGKRAITVLIVGETARAENFSLNGYPRDTNPQLKQLDIINFPDFHSCGTSTAVSVPCMFSRDDRENFDGHKAKYTENVLDVINHAGIPVIWLDNNSGCKKVCARVGYESLANSRDPDHCADGMAGDHDGECYDSILIKNLVKTIESTKGNLMLVLHQKGSHGPAYYLRTPPKFQRFQPACKSAQLQFCSREEITNSYDNSLLYTDFIIAGVIKTLESHQADYDSSLIYLSDHGESLGENRLFLHGLPYMIAPSQQTHVPFLTWLSEGYAERFQIDQECLQAKSTEIFSQDNLFDSLLGLMNIRTTVYRPDMDIYNSCQGGGK